MKRIALLILTIFMLPSWFPLWEAYAELPAFWSRAYNTANPPHPPQLVVTPALSHAIFTNGTSITISNTAGGNIDLARKIAGNAHVYIATNVASPYTFTASTNGYYMAQCDNDRTAFTVKPAGYQGATWFGVEYGDTNRANAINLKINRAHGAGYWSLVQTAAPPAALDWSLVDGNIWQDKKRGTQKIVITSGFPRPSWQTDDATFIPMHTTHISNMAAHIVSLISTMSAPPAIEFEVWNEYAPGLSGTPSSFTFTNYVDMCTQAYTAVNFVTNGLFKLRIGNYVNFPNYQTHLKLLSTQIPTAMLTNMGVNYHDYDDGRFPPSSNTFYDVATTVSNRYNRISQMKAWFPNSPIDLDETAFFGQSMLGTTNVVGDSLSSSPTIDGFTGAAYAMQNVAIYKVNGVRDFIVETFLTASGGANPADSYNWELNGGEHGSSGGIWRGQHYRSACIIHLNNLIGSNSPVSLATNNFLWNATFQTPTNRISFVWMAQGTTNLPGVVLRDVFGNVDGGPLGKELRFFTSPDFLIIL